MIALYILGGLLFVAAFAWLSRMAGGGWPKLPLGLDQHIYAIPYVVVGALCAHFGGMGLYWTIGLGVLSYLTAFLAKRTGHGQFMTLPYSLKAISAERLDFLVRPFFGKDPRVDVPNLPLDKLQRNIIEYGESKLMKRNLFGLFITGMGVSLGAAISAVVSGFYLVAILLFVSSGFKALAYYLGYKFRGNNTDPNKFFKTEIGEILTGLFAGIGLLASMVLVFRKKKDD